MEEAISAFVHADVLQERITITTGGKIREYVTKTLSTLQVYYTLLDIKTLIIQSIGSILLPYRLILNAVSTCNIKFDRPTKTQL